MPNSTHPFNTPPPPTKFALVSFPTPQILLVVFNRPMSLNAISTASHWELDALFSWYDNEPSLRCAIVTGAGRAWCAGADLKEWDRNNASSSADSSQPQARVLPRSGFAALSRRMGKKPVIGAVNGLAFGGGMEAVVNLDLVVATRSARFALPEVKRGVVAIAGALPRLVRTVGRQRAMELALTGRIMGAEEARSWGIVNYVVDDGKIDGGKEEEVVERPVVKKALEIAEGICQNSPDSVIVSRAGILAGWEDGSAEHATQALVEVWQRRLDEGENLREGVKAFVEKREPRWRDSKL